MGDRISVQVGPSMIPPSGRWSTLDSSNCVNPSPSYKRCRGLSALSFRCGPAVMCGKAEPGKETQRNSQDDERPGFVTIAARLLSICHSSKVWRTAGLDLRLPSTMADTIPYLVKNFFHLIGNTSAVVLTRHTFVRKTDRPSVVELWTPR